MRKIFIFIGLFVFSDGIYSQYEQKYLDYRERFTKYFTVVGGNVGESNVCNRRNAKAGGDFTNGSREMRFGDQTTNLGDYIAMLAMEYKVLSNEGSSVVQTAKELYYALYAFNRLDLVAETHFGNAAELNGFFIRDDVYDGTAFVSSHPELNDGLIAPTPPNYYVEYSILSGDVQWVDRNKSGVSDANFIFPTKCDETFNDDDNDFDDQEDFSTTDLMSPDQVIGLYFGMAMVVKCVPSSANYNGLAFQDGNVNFVNAARAITDRITTWMQDHSWDVESPTGCKLFGGTDWMKYAYAIAAGEIMGEHDKYLGIGTTGVGWCAIDGYMDADEALCNQFTDWDNCNKTFNWKICILLAAIGNSWDCLFGNTYTRIVNHSSKYDNWKYFYPLIYTVLHGGESAISQSEIETLLFRAPDNGPFNHSTSNGSSDFGNWGWCTPFIFRSDDNEQQGVGSDGGNYPNSPGNYHGLDFMLLHNMYKIIYKLSPPQEIPICTFAPNHLTISNVTISDDNDLHVKNTITTSENVKITNGTDVWWTAGDYIELNAGFEIEGGATAVFEILDCEIPNGRMANPDSSGTRNKGGVTSQQSAVEKEQLASKSEISNQQLVISNQLFSLYPNPNNGTMQMDYRLQEGENGELIIYDITGRKIKRFLLSSQNNTLQIQDSELKDGVYLYHVIVNNEIKVSEKLVVIR